MLKICFCLPIVRLAAANRVTVCKAISRGQSNQLFKDTYHG